MTQPRISVVTPSYNQGKYLEDTIQSVLGQNYANLEYIIMDGGSTDHSVEIIKKYERHVAYWVSEKDGGQSSALNAGFKKSTGDILCWLNSDDMLLPNALNYVASELDVNRSELLFGNCLHMVEGGADAYGSDVQNRHESSDLKLTDYIIQPSAFWTKRAWEATGILDENLHYGFDWDWFIRARESSVVFKPRSKYLAIYRFHEEHKTGTGSSKRSRELAAIYKRHAGASYEELYVKACRHRVGIYRVRKLLRKCRMDRQDTSALKMIFPGLFKPFSRNEINDVLSMV